MVWFSFWESTSRARCRERSRFRRLVSFAKDELIGGGDEVEEERERVSSSLYASERVSSSASDEMLPLKPISRSPSLPVVSLRPLIRLLTVLFVAIEITLPSAVRREERRNLRSSSFCLRISRSKVRLIARSDELLISRSRTLRSRRAWAANSLRWSSLL